MADYGKELNFIMGDTIHIYDAITAQTCAKLCGDMAETIKRIRPKTFILKQITNPYDVPEDVPAIDLIINSVGGNVSTITTIIGLLNLAKMKGIIIRTNVFGTASSAASTLAIMGTPGFRIIQEESFHFIHYGSSIYNITKDTELEKTSFHIKEIKDASNRAYLTHTKITPEKLAKLKEDEAGYLNAKQCLRLGFCDWILKNDGQLVRR